MNGKNVSYSLNNLIESRQFVVNDSTISSMEKKFDRPDFTNARYATNSGIESDNCISLINSYISLGRMSPFDNVINWKVSEFL